VDTTLGIVVDSGRLIATAPPLAVTLVQAVARVNGLELELLAQRPLDLRSALERQADIRSGADRIEPAPRILLPAADEGRELRVGWIGDNGRANWVFARSSNSSSGSSRGWRFRGRFTVPIASGTSTSTDTVTIALAWPEIGFPERTFDLQLPAAEVIARASESIWDAPVAPGSPLPAGLPEQPIERVRPSGEIGRAVADPQVLLRNEVAVVALTRLSVQGELLSAEIISVAKGQTADSIRAATFPRYRAPDRSDSAEPRATIGVLVGGEIRPCAPMEGTGSGGDLAIRDVSTFHFPRPDNNELQLLVSWPAAELAQTLIVLALTG
jgi:hypothetical protein